MSWNGNDEGLDVSGWTEAVGFGDFRGGVGDFRGGVGDFRGGIRVEVSD